MSGGPFARVEAIVNLASGSVDADAPKEMEAILAEFGLKARIHTPAPDALEGVLRGALAADPELLIVLAGDGTARAAAELCGPQGPLLLILPGGTMNMLPHALVGNHRWQAALRLALTEGQERPLSGGVVEGRHFLVAAILGAPAHWAPAREAVRERRLEKAWASARTALQRAFTGRLRFVVGDGLRDKAEALVFMTPLTSRALDSRAAALEAAAIDVRNPGQAIRLGFQALIGDWRDDPLVQTQPCTAARIWSARNIPALLDGEMVKLRPMAEVRYIPHIARVLVLPEHPQA